MSFHQLIGQLLAINGVVDGAADGDVGGDIIADGITLGIFFPGRYHREDDATVLHAIAYPELQILLLWGYGHGGSDADQIQLAALRRGVGVIFVEEDEHQTVKVVFLASVVGVSLDD